MRWEPQKTEETMELRGILVVMDVWCVFFCWAKALDACDELRKAILQRHQQQPLLKLGAVPKLLDIALKSSTTQDVRKAVGEKSDPATNIYRNLIQQQVN